MSSAYPVLALLMSLMATLSGAMKLRREPKTIKIIHEVVGLPLKFLPFLAACEFGGAIGLLVGIAWPPIGVAAAAGLVLYFVGASIAHVRVGDFSGLGPAVFMLFMSGACLILRLHSS
jgi:uncharacterized membrane protein YphA (DoxX/SURF4 family)